jgi:hypothetical protein
MAGDGRRIETAAMFRKLVSLFVPLLPTPRAWVELRCARRLRAELARMRCDLARWHVRECGGESGARAK